MSLNDYYSLDPSTVDPSCAGVFKSKQIFYLCAMRSPIKLKSLPPI